MLRKLPSFLKSSAPATVASNATVAADATVAAPAEDTGAHRSAPVDSGAQGCAPVDTEEEDCEPLVVGSMRSAREHAEKLAEVLRGTGATDRAIYQGELQDLHWEMCECLGWLPKGWPAVCRELAKLPGVKRGMLKINGQRLTAYEVAPAAESSTNVVSIGERREAS